QRINVGPESAGADPGPACYGRGGARPAVTDADVVLGRLDPAYFAGGTIPLEPDRAAAAPGDRSTAWPCAPRGCPRHQRDRRGEHGECRACTRRRARQGSAFSHPDRLRWSGPSARRAPG
ncbi:MAG: hypothetical protein J2P51_08500, partial [Hyphomicrobiaceae bacterium]|nr:hypothetical protein [Hyphomicrobiaceae bacterium]